MANTKNSTASSENKHQSRMQRKKAVVDISIAAANIQRGQFLINTTDGKRKSTAVFSMLVRTLGYDFQNGVQAMRGMVF